MATNLVKLYKVNTVPSSGWEPNAIYLEQGTGDYVNFYVANSDGTAVKHLPKVDEIETLITDRFNTTLQVFNDYNSFESTGLEDKKKIKFAYVIDATGDSTVESGGAFYALTDPSQGTFTKVAEQESFNEVNISGAKNWSELAGKPSSTPTKIDEAVQKMHEHTNKTVLDKLSDSDGKLFYDGKAVDTTLQWTETEW